MGKVQELLDSAVKTVRERKGDWSPEQLAAIASEELDAVRPHLAEAFATDLAAALAAPLEPSAQEVSHG